jgi:hypothetical protein
MKAHQTGVLALLLVAALITSIAVVPIAYAQHKAASLSGTITTISTTVPPNGDVNPYGVFRITRTVGKLTRGNILVSNFNNSSNLQGTGTTIVQISPTGAFSVFAQIDASALPGPCPGGVGLTTALVELRSGWVVVGSLPTADGTAATAQAGCLLVLDSNGNVVETLANSEINGPWDMTVFDETGRKGMPSRAILFVNNVLNGTVAAGGNVVNQGTTLRIVLKVPPSGMPSAAAMTVIGSGFSERTDPAALVIGPTGLALSKNNKVLYVADSLNNRIAAISNPLTRTSSAGTGSTVSSGGALNDPLGMTLAVNGNILTVNGNDGSLVETTSRGAQISVTTLDDTIVPGSLPGAGTLFGLTDVPAEGVVFVDDGSNTLNQFP